MAAVRGRSKRAGKTKPKAASNDAAAKTKRGRGRPRDYDPNLHPWLAETLAAAGLTDAEIAGRLRKAESTIEAWKKYPEFSEALRRGKKPANDLVKRSLFQRAIGYSYPSEEIFCAFGKVTRVQTVKHSPPDVTAGMFWLVNRDKKNWKHIAHVDHTSGGEKLTNTVFRSVINPDGSVSCGPVEPAPAAAAPAPGGADAPEA